MKGADGEAGNNARQALRFLEGLRLSGDLVKGVALPSRGTVRLEVNHVDADLPQGLDPNSRAGRVLKVCRGLMDEGTPATLVSRDMVARIRAQMIGVPAEEVPLAIIQGPAGTAKTFYALAAGLEQVLETEERPYRKILVCRPNAQFDADIGFLPGSEQEKISPSCGPLWTIWKFCWIWRGRKRSGTALAVGMIVAAAVAIIALLVIKKNAEKKAAVN